MCEPPYRAAPFFFNFVSIAGILPSSRLTVGVFFCLRNVLFCSRTDWPADDVRPKPADAGHQETASGATVLHHAPGAAGQVTAADGSQQQQVCVQRGCSSPKRDVLRRCFRLTRPECPRR
ncbi:uncharacterized protein LOC119767775 [Culex quinquefasciatus]|uniref:uncharacterized protein LOC119767352 n=1 Tax=Culex quinquefasciatus TaxID=7176 RepID=UPI0018E35D4C|nr:uncharacterized protein LOC119767352 [Culex quinquefasciatus]XP_038113167.1 uncharacterized protein LOC119767775 [Culex quinquefasciatus]